MSTTRMQIKSDGTFHALRPIRLEERVAVLRRASGRKNRLTRAFALAVAARTDFSGAFVQDEIALIPDEPSVTRGSEFERSTFSGRETQSTLRVLWHPP